MATSKPRITITLEPKAYDTVSRLATASKRSMSSVVTDFLDLAQPQMERTVEILEAAAKAPHQAQEEIRQALERAESALMPALLESLRRTDEALHQHGLDWGDVSEAKDRRLAKERRAGRAPEAHGRSGARTPPVPVTRGVGTPKKAGQAKKKGVKRG